MMMGLDDPRDLGGLEDQIDPVSGMDVGLSWYCPGAGRTPPPRSNGRGTSDAPKPLGGPAVRPHRLVPRCSSSVGPDQSSDARRAPSRDHELPVEHAHFLVDHIPNAVLVELDSADHLIWFSDAIDALTVAIPDVPRLIDDHVLLGRRRPLPKPDQVDQRTPSPTEAGG